MLRYPTLTPGDKPVERGRRVPQETQEPYKNGRVKLNLLHMHKGSPLLPVFRALSNNNDLLEKDGGP